MGHLPYCSRAPRLPWLLLGPTLLLTAAARLWPVVFEALRRDPGALAQGQLWRLLSPTLVQADIFQSHGVARALAVAALVAGVLVIAERGLGAWRSAALYLLGALVGHGVGELWQPFTSGCSVAGCGVLGGLAAWLLQARRVQVQLGAALVLVAAGIGAALRDIHGPPLLAGALVSPWLLASVPLPRVLREPAAR